MGRPPGMRHGKGMACTCLLPINEIRNTQGNGEVGCSVWSTATVKLCVPQKQGSALVFIMRGEAPT